MNAEDVGVPLAVGAVAPDIAVAVELVAGAFRDGGRLFYVGAGTSGRLGVLDASECPPTFRTPPEMVVGIIAGGMRALTRSVEGAEDDVNAGIAEMDLQQVRAHDVVVGIAASGTTPYVRAALGRAQALGARTVLVTCAEPPALLRDTCDVCIVAKVGPEVVTGSTRLKAGTATKMILNMLTTGAMVLIGKTYGNLMVDVQASNVKLADRAERIIMEATGCPRAGAQALLGDAGGEVKTAIVMGRLGVAAPEARHRLAEAGGRLRVVVGAPPEVTAG
jgi:N-acetylmuramic acid 6-phosphate etherase